MSDNYTEANYENSVIELFRNDLEYEYVYGPDIERDFYNPLYEEVLLDSLYRLNRDLPDDAIQDALFKLKNFENGEEELSKKYKNRTKNKNLKVTSYFALIAVLLVLISLAYNGENTNNQTNLGTESNTSQIQNWLNIENEEIIQEENSSNDNISENVNLDSNNENKDDEKGKVFKLNEKPEINLSDIPEYSSSTYVTINNGNPFFDESEFSTKSFENYSDLDSLGRCQVAVSNIGKDLMPTKPRGEIGSVKPTGWHLIKYDGIDGKYLYNRCHLIGYQLTGENANPKNLITGTRYLNTKGMLPFENKVADYIRETSNHVMYRVTPIFQGDNLLASGVLIEAESVEDNGEGIKFNVYCYNVQPGITINYANGDSSKK